MKTSSRLCGAVAAALLLAVSGTAQTEERIRVPDCNTLERIASTINTDDREPINEWVEVSSRNTNLTLVAAVAVPEFEAAFGKPMVRWTQKDLTLFRPAVAQCMKAAAKAKRFDAQKQLIELRGIVQFHLGRVVSTVNRARERMVENIDALQALPADAVKLKIFTLLARLGELSRQQAITEVRQPIERMRVPGATPARLVAANLQTLPQDEADAYLRRIRNTRDTLYDEVIARIRRTIEAAPASVQGLAEIERALTEELGEVSDLLPPDARQAIEAAAEPARERAWAAVETRVAGSQDLSALTMTPAARSLSREDAARLQQLVAARRAQLSNVAVQEAINGLTNFPRTLDGLREFVAYARKTRSALGRQVVGAQRQPFENAYYEQHQQRMVQVRGELESALAEMPATREGIAQINQLLQDIDAPARSDLYLAGMNRAAEIAAAAERAERRAQCGDALRAADLGRDDAALAVMGLGRDTLTLEDFICEAALAGNQVHGHDGPGFFNDDHVIEITGRDGIYRTYVLNPAQVGPDTEALVGVRVTDPTSERNLDVQGWRRAVAALLPDRPAARNARCEQLMNTAEGDLTARDRMAAMQCLLGTLMGQ